jgi:hypothetical protein
MCFLHLFSNKCIIYLFIKGKDHYHMKEEEILYVGFALFFQFSFIW